MFITNLKGRCESFSDMMSESSEQIATPAGEVVAATHSTMNGNVAKTLSTTASLVMQQFPLFLLCATVIPWILMFMGFERRHIVCSHLLERIRSNALKGV